MVGMQQTDLGLSLSTKRTNKREFLAQMEQMVPWADLVDLVSPSAPQRKTGRPPFGVLTMLRVNFMHQWFTLSDLAMEEALQDVPLFREFAGLTLGRRLHDETMIMRFRHLLEQQKLADQILATIKDLLQRMGLLLKTGTVVDATLIAALSSTKNKAAGRNPEMHQSKKGNHWYFAMTSPKGNGQRTALVREADAGDSLHKAHIGVDVHSGPVHTVRGTAANVNDVVEGNSLLHAQATEVFADAGYQGADKQLDAPESVAWHAWHGAMEPGKRKVQDKTIAIGRLKEQLERVKASIRAEVEHPFREIKLQFGHMKVRYRGLAKNTAQLKKLFALSGPWMAREKFEYWMGKPIQRGRLRSEKGRNSGL
jgi:transposase, IS5 family